MVLSLYFVIGHNCASIFKLQKKAIRIITHSHFQSQTLLLFRKLELLTLPDLYSLAIPEYSYSYVHQTLPLYHLSLNICPNAAYHSYNTRNRYNLTIPIIRHHFATKSIRHSVTTLINSLPQNISEKIHTHSLHALIAYFKNHLLGHYKPCEVLNCYICLLN